MSAPDRETVMREHARRIAHLPEDKIGNIIVTSYDEGPDRVAMRHFVHEAQDELNAPPAIGATTRDDVQGNAVRAERTRRIREGEQYGYGALAKHFHVSKATIRRRLGALDNK